MILHRARPALASLVVGGSFQDRSLCLFLRDCPPAQALLLSLLELREGGTGERQLTACLPARTDARTSLGITHTLRPWPATYLTISSGLDSPPPSTYRTYAYLTLLPLIAKTCAPSIFCFARHDRFTNTRTICDDLPRAADSDRTARCSSSLTGILGTVACHVYSSPAHSTYFRQYT